MAVAFRSLFLTKNTSLRGVETANGEQFFSVYDFLNFLTGRERGDEHAQSVFFYLTDETEQGEEVWSRFHEFKVQGLQGARSQSVRADQERARLCRRHDHARPRLERRRAFGPPREGLRARLRPRNCVLATPSSGTSCTSLTLSF